MDELISREAALTICQKEYEERLRMADYCGDTVAWNIGGKIKALPAVDAAPVAHGRWYMNSDRPDTIICDNCQVGFDVWKHEKKDFRFCPSCGARTELPGGVEND